MTYNLSACVFIRDTFKGAFCLFEGMATFLPLVDEFVVMDLGSTDGTYEVLREISIANPKIKLVNGSFPEVDAAAFATLANDLIALCENDNVLYYQSDEIWHECLLGMMKERFEQGDFDLSFWRIQYRENFQKVKWFPYPVHRVGHKDSFNFVGDGMNSDRYLDAKMCSTYNGGWFSKWGEKFKDEPRSLSLNEMNLDVTDTLSLVDNLEGSSALPQNMLPTKEMILDVSLVGAFLENIPERRRMHTPFWHEPATNMPSDENNMLITEWIEKERKNPNWFKKTSPFKVPRIMEWHLGKMKYELRPELLQALKDDTNFILDGVGEWR